MAHLQGTDYVGSMVVLEDGLPNKREYRRFKVKHVPGNDDYAAMEEVLTRRLTAYLDERDRPISERGERPGKFAYPPQLLLVDGGKGQLGVAQRVVESLGLADEIPVAGLAKRFEEVYVPGRSDPVEVPRGSEALFMLQRIRDEAHRFANTFHGERRSKRMTASSLDGIPGLGEARKKQARQGDGRRQRREAGVDLDELQALELPARRRRRGDPRRSSTPDGAPVTTAWLDDLGARSARACRGVARGRRPKLKSGTMNSSKPSSAYRPMASTISPAEPASERPANAPVSRLRRSCSASSVRNTSACTDVCIVVGSRPTASHAARNAARFVGRRRRCRPTCSTRRRGGR